jgi:hypothetical protein
MANEPAASEATPLVAMVEVADRVVLAVVPVVRVVMVEWAVVDQLPLAEVEVRVEDGMVMVELAELVVLVTESDPEADADPLALALAEVSVAVSVAESVTVALPVAEPVTEPLFEGLAPPPTILKGKPYWNTWVSDSRMILMP